MAGSSSCGYGRGRGSEQRPLEAAAAGVGQDTLPTDARVLVKPLSLDALVSAVRTTRTLTLTGPGSCLPGLRLEDFRDQRREVLLLADGPGRECLGDRLLFMRHCVVGEFRDQALPGTRLRCRRSIRRLRLPMPAHSITWSARCSSGGGRDLSVRAARSARRRSCPSACASAGACASARVAPLSRAGRTSRRPRQAAARAPRP